MIPPSRCFVNREMSFAARPLGFVLTEARKRVEKHGENISCLWHKHSCLCGFALHAAKPHRQECLCHKKLH